MHGLEACYILTAQCTTEECILKNQFDDDENPKDVCCKYFRGGCCSEEENNYLTLV